MSKISKNITYKEAIHSNTAKRLGIDNEPSHEQIANMMTIAEMIFQPLRSWVGGPIKITSFFRSPNLIRLLEEVRQASTVQVKQWILMMYMGINQMQKCLCI